MLEVFLATRADRYEVTFNLGRPLRVGRFRLCYCSAVEHTFCDAITKELTTNGRTETINLFDDYAGSLSVRDALAGCSSCHVDCRPSGTSPAGIARRYTRATASRPDLSATMFTIIGVLTAICDRSAVKKRHVNICCIFYACKIVTYHR